MISIRRELYFPVHIHQVPHVALPIAKVNYPCTNVSFSILLGHVCSQPLATGRIKGPPSRRCLKRPPIPTPHPHAPLLNTSCFI